jgi:hypothetical protein
MFSLLSRRSVLHVMQTSSMTSSSSSPSSSSSSHSHWRHFVASHASLRVPRQHLATKPVKGTSSNAAPSRTTKSNNSNAAAVVSRPTPTAKPAAPTSASALAAKKVVDEIIADRRRDENDDDDDDDDEDEDDSIANDEPEPLTREDLLKRSKAGFDASTIAQLRRWLPRDDKPVSAAVAAQCAKLLNRTSEQHLDVVNLPAMYLCRIIAEAKWHVFLSPTKQGVLLAFSSAESLAAFSPALPKDQFELMTGYEIGAAIVDDDDNTVKGVAFDPATIQRLKPSLPASRLMVLLHWADAIYFEKFVASADPTAPILKPDPDDADAYDPRVLWHRSYVIGALGGEGDNPKPEDVQLLSDSDDRIVVFGAPDHVAEAIADGRVMPVSLSAEELIGVLETQKTGISITVGADFDMDDKPTRHKSVTWTNEQALSILRASRPQPGEPGYEELTAEPDVQDAEIAEPKAEKKVVQRREKPGKAK